jgi:hypothetical protein
MDNMPPLASIPTCLWLSTAKCWPLCRVQQRYISKAYFLKGRGRGFVLRFHKGKQKQAIITPFHCNNFKTLSLLKSKVVCVLTPCSLERLRHSGGTYRLHLQGRRLSQARDHKKQDRKFNSSCRLLLLVS